MTRMQEAQSQCCSHEGQHSKEECCGIPQVLHSGALNEHFGQLPAFQALVNSCDDFEKSVAGLEHVTLGVQGMTCAGCERKLYHFLSGLPSVTNVRTSLLLSRADFDLDLSLNSASEIVLQIQRATGFTCERLTNKGEQIDVMTEYPPSILLSQPMPQGVTAMVLLDKQTVRISYDPGIIGARDLLRSGFNAPLQLASRQLSSSVSTSEKYIRKMGYLALLSVILTVPVLLLAWAPFPPHPRAYGAVSLLLATAIQMVIAGPFYSSALKALILFHVTEMDLLVVLSTSTAYIFSVVSFGYLVKGDPLSTELYFASSTLLVTLIMLGRYISALARQKAVDSISVRSLQPATGILIAFNGEKVELDARLLQYGDIILIPPGSQVVTDGTILSGTSEVDESAITGESRLIPKSARCAVVAGTINVSGPLEVRVTGLPSNNTISAIASMVDEAKLSKPKIQKAVDRVTSFFVPLIVICAVITFVVWTSVYVVVRRQSVSGAVVHAITLTVAVLIVSCPCALGLAVPMIIAIAGGIAAKHGVIVKSAEAIEMARGVSHVVFDKTGTLTQGNLAVHVEWYLVGLRQRHTMSLLLGLISNIEHPVSRSVRNHLVALNVVSTSIEDILHINGQGVEGTVDGMIIRAGNSRWLGIESWPPVQSLLSQGLTVFCIAIGLDIAAIFGLHDVLRPDALPVISSLRSHGILVSIISGDDDGAVQRTAAQLGISAEHAKSCCSPADKQQYIKHILGANEKNVVLFCGDGTNDAAALAQASVGVHMSEGTQLAQSAADVVLVRSALGGLLILIDLSDAAFQRIYLSFAWSGIYNVFAILLAAGAFVRARIPAEYAGLGEIVSVLPVLAIALQLRWHDARRGKLGRALDQS